MALATQVRGIDKRVDDLSKRVRLCEADVAETKQLALALRADHGQEKEKRSPPFLPMLPAKEKRLFFSRCRSSPLSFRCCSREQQAFRLALIIERFSRQTS